MYFNINNNLNAKIEIEFVLRGYFSDNLFELHNYSNVQEI